MYQHPNETIVFKHVDGRCYRYGREIGRGTLEGFRDGHRASAHAVDASPDERTFHERMAADAHAVLTEARAYQPTRRAA